MSGDGLILGFIADEDGTGKLTGVVRSNGYSGVGSAWFSVGELREFAMSLRAYPLPRDSRLRIAGGFHSQSAPHELEQEHLAIEVYPVGIRGQIAFRVSVSTEVWENCRPESQNRATVEILSTYARAEQFSRQLEALVAGLDSEARLEVEKLM